MAIGALPFHVWQIWDAMVTCLKKGDVLRFVAGAGVMAHYVGDASQPLHCSYMHHGVPPMRKVSGRSYPVPRDSDEFKESKKSREAKIHGIYEETMLEVDPAGALAAVDDELKKRRAVSIDRSGHRAAKAVIALMNDAQTRLAPNTIIDADDPSQSQTARAKALWDDDQISKATIRSLADGVGALAALWTSAWQVGAAPRSPRPRSEPTKKRSLSRSTAAIRSSWPSLGLDAMAESGKFEP
ncbi:hypothetical protein IP86_17425 [Rhodopseudomonas sp. AAP120]|uniref:hypothetical protein n=1 Tax=Rhodopseudomonas TaxID=1073 RepID=UPI0006BA058A|nr:MULTISPECIES: hypothetical protein [Rhodopseudomonas]KPF96194.1 hypothetical protein IP86_17425 [Rhodopseudomonas sp. AAP120]